MGSIQVVESFCLFRAVHHLVRSVSEINGARITYKVYVLQAPPRKEQAYHLPLHRMKHTLSFLEPEAKEGNSFGMTFLNQTGI